MSWSPRSVNGTHLLFFCLFVDSSLICGSRPQSPTAMHRRQNQAVAAASSPSSSSAPPLRNFQLDDDKESPPVNLDHMPLALQDVIRSYLAASTDMSGLPHPENHHVETIAPRDLHYIFRSDEIAAKSLQWKVLAALAIVFGSICAYLFWHAQWWLIVYLHGSDADATAQWTPVNFFRPVQRFYCALYALMLLVDWVGYLFVWRSYRKILSKLVLFRNPYAPKRCLVYDADLDAVAEANSARRERGSGMWLAGSIACVYLLPQASVCTAGVRCTRGCTLVSDLALCVPCDWLSFVLCVPVCVAVRRFIRGSSSGL